MIVDSFAGPVYFNGKRAHVVSHFIIAQSASMMTFAEQSFHGPPAHTP